MTKIKELISKERSQYLVFIGLSIGVIVLTGIIYFSDTLLFQRFIGGINPLIASFFIILLGVISLSFLLSRGWFAIYKKETGSVGIGSYPKAQQCHFKVRTLSLIKTKNSFISFLFKLLNSALPCAAHDPIS